MKQVSFWRFTWAGVLLLAFGLAACQGEVNNELAAQYKVLGVWKLTRLQTKLSENGAILEEKNEILKADDRRIWKLSENGEYRTETSQGRLPDSVSIGLWELQGVEMDSALLLLPARGDSLPYRIEKLSVSVLELWRNQERIRIDTTTMDTVRLQEEERLIFEKEF
ncbi:hypothetical protein [Hugenholtzia roseola]|uniref:hypothetical protein n=1 Tax=Hugenholtzia roseola TaxID=1002 RepID=UPI0003FF9D80|nr:hypothetical protein [Hugenholtzia roseola]